MLSAEYHSTILTSIVRGFFFKKKKKREITQNRKTSNGIKNDYVFKPYGIASHFSKKQ